MANVTSGKIRTLVSLTAGCVLTAGAGVVHVAPDGDDANDGAAGRPVATPARAAECARALRLRGERVEVVFADGLWRLEAPLALGAADSGTEAAPVVWRAEHRGKAVFTGATALAWKRGENCLHTATIAGNDPLPGFFMGGCMAHYEKKLDKPVFLVQDDGLLPIARYPNEGWMRATEFSGGTVTTNTLAGYFLTRRGAAAKLDAPAERIAKWAAERDLWAYGLWHAEWADARLMVTNIDVKTGMMAVRQDYPLPFKDGYPYRIENAVCEIDEPGEWTLERATRTLTLMKKGAGFPAAVTRLNLITVRGASHIVFDGIALECARGDAMTLNDCRDVTVRGGTVHLTGGWGVRVTGGARCRVEGCDMWNLGEGGVRLEGGDLQSLEPAEHVADNNHIHHYGRFIANYRPGVSLNGVGCRATHNLVHHSEHQAFNFNGNDHYIGYNVMHDICQHNNDAGAIYACEYYWTKRGTVVEHNLVHMVGRKPRPTHCQAVYLDDSSSGTTVRGNILVRASMGVAMGGGNCSLVQSNIIVRTLESPVNFASRGPGSFADHGRKGGMRDGYKSGTFRQLERMKPHIARYPEKWGRYPHLLDTFTVRPPAGVKMEPGYWAHHQLWSEVIGNLYVATPAFQDAYFKKVAAYNTYADNASTDEDPGFADYAKLDFSAKKGGRYEALIAYCDFPKMGLYDSPARFSPAVKYSPDRSDPEPLKRMYAQASARVDVVLRPAGVPDGSPVVKDLEGCEAPLWAKGRRICMDDRTKPVPDEWTEFSFAFTPTVDMTVTFDVRSSEAGGKTQYDDFVVTGAELVNGDCETAKGWRCFRDPPKNARADVTRPFGLVEGTLVASHDVNATQDIRVTKGRRVTIRFRARRFDDGERLKSLEALRDEARRTGAKEIVVPAGTYRLARPLVLDARDSGVTWKAQGEVIVSGAMSGLAWRALEAGEQPLVPAAARPHVRVADIPGTGPLPGFMSNGCGVKKVKDYEQPLSVFSSETRCEPARWPDKDFYVCDTMAEVPRLEWKGDIPFRSPRLAKWAQEKDAYVRGIWMYFYVDEVTRLKSVDPKGGSFTVEQPFYPRGRRKWPHFHILNAFSELDRPGEWAADLAGRRLYVWPANGKVADLRVTGIDHLLVVSNAADIAFTGFTFEHARRDAVCFESCTNVRLVASCVRHTSTWGVNVTGGRACRVEGCDLYDLGEGGVRLEGGARRRLVPAEHVAINNHIRHYGQVVWNYRPGIGLFGVGCRAEHNLIHHTRHQGVSFEGNDHYIGFNVVHDTCLYNNDAGAIYGYTETLDTRGTVIEYNGVFMTGDQPYPEHVKGLYIDGFMSECVVRGNIVNHTISGQSMSGGFGNVFEKNVFVNVGQAFGQYNYGLQGKDRRPYTPDVPKGRQSNRCKPLIDILDSPDGPLWRKRYPMIDKWLAVAEARGFPFAQCAILNTFRDNAYCCALKPQFKDIEFLGPYLTITNNVEITGDPGFTDYAGRDWSLKPDSPIRAVIGGDTRFAEMGLLKDAPRFSPPVKFGADVSPVPPLAPVYSRAYARIDVEATSKAPAGETEFADGLERCTLIGGAWRIRRVSGIQGHAPRGVWKAYSYSFVPRYDCDAVVKVLGEHGMKTAYDDVRVTGCAWAEGGFENPSAWNVGKPDSAWSYLADMSAPLGIVAGTPAFPAYEGTRYAISHHMMKVERPVKLKKGVRVTVSFKARAFEWPEKGPSALRQGDASLGSLGIREIKKPLSPYPQAKRTPGAGY